MPVPKYYFIALLKVKGEAYNAIAFWVEHKDYGNTSPTTERLAAHAVSVDRLEALTGLDFFHNLPDAVEKAVEQRCDLAYKEGGAERPAGSAPKEAPMNGPEPEGPQLTFGGHLEVVRRIELGISN